MLSGYKTYITALLIGGVSAARYLGWLPVEMAETLTGLLVGGGLAFLRMGVKKEG